MDTNCILYLILIALIVALFFLLKYLKKLNDMKKEQEIKRSRKTATSNSTRKSVDSSDAELDELYHRLKMYQAENQKCLNKLSATIKSKNEICNILYDISPDFSNLEFEASVLCYSVVGLGLALAKQKNPELMCGIRNNLFKLCDKEKYTGRAKQYAFVKDLDLRDYCHLLYNNDKPDLLYKFLILFFDIIIHPECADNYSAEPLKITDSFEILVIHTEYVPKVYSILIELIEIIMK